jgi:UDP-glucose 4-epimerase
MHPYEPLHSVAEISHARKALGWQPRHRLAHAVWQLAKETYPQLTLKEPNRDTGPL